MGVKPIKILTDRMKDENVSNAILVLRGDITPFAKQAVLEMSDSFRIEHFKEAELLVDITEHTLVRCSQKEMWTCVVIRVCVRGYCDASFRIQQTNRNVTSLCNWFLIAVSLRSGSRTCSSIPK